MISGFLTFWTPNTPSERELEVKLVHWIWLLFSGSCLSHEYSLLFGLFGRSIPSQPGRKTKAGQWCDVS